VIVVVESPIVAVYGLEEEYYGNRVKRFVFVLQLLRPVFVYFYCRQGRCGKNICDIGKVRGDVALCFLEREKNLNVDRVDIKSWDYGVCWP
jgi:hypothetical protein